ncbi:hypothetical protein BC827DRAFT_1227159 [Russula dissimulans]|nr:hypothetical protein BC827DRAFT_1252676 [Russula dissimulans]KAH9952803.1 hypothetical protein BC827DRAFT_1252345 [Russula dissimulans]KAH9957244.1 hypothetical protein BC827DRAFT_1227159 [Russula dissimulans]
MIGSHLPNTMVLYYLLPSEDALLCNVVREDGLRANPSLGPRMTTILPCMLPYFKL